MGGVAGRSGTQVADDAARQNAEDLRAGTAVLAPDPVEGLWDGAVAFGADATVVVPEVCGTRHRLILVATAGRAADSGNLTRTMLGPDHGPQSAASCQSPFTTGPVGIRGL
ncbi:hypothetical protein QF037_000703 [Streptomyces canus]|nr:hypothetical protein [Streptomyces canus]